ncbi:unnamed protein product [Discula destructiva]
MVLSKKLLTLGSLAVSAVALPSSHSQKPLTDDEDNDTPLPLIIWHGELHLLSHSPSNSHKLQHSVYNAHVHPVLVGLGDSYGNEGIQSVAALADAVHPGTLVHVVAQGADPNADQRATFWGDVNAQIDALCDAIAANPIIRTAPAVDALGFSQGGQFLRGWLERCDSAPPVRSLVTFGSQHNGITEFQDCAPTNWLCKGAMALLRGNVWSAYVQSNLVPAQYYRPTMDYEAYLENSNFLADINNERADKSSVYKRRLAEVAHFVMFMFEEDTTVIPKESAWFSEVNGTEVTPLRSRQIYHEDWLGLKELDRKAGLVFRTAPGAHMHLDEELLNDTFREWFGPLKKYPTQASLVDEL